MTKSFLTATAFAALLGFGANAAVAQQSAPKLEAPAIEKSAPAPSGKAAAERSGAAQNKPAAPAQGATLPGDKAKRDSTAAKPADRRATRDAAQVCATIKDKTAQEACVKAHAQNSGGSQNQSATSPAGKTDGQKDATPEKSPEKAKTPRTGG